jgi:hypothetical protein
MLGRTVFKPLNVLKEMVKYSKFSYNTLYIRMSTQQQCVTNSLFLQASGIWYVRYTGSSTSKYVSCERVKLYFKKLTILGTSQTF